ncbi:uncharacterized protein LOC124060169 [Scomber scombrus]|uniref:Uncharacterized protein LOC124060169 n=1 Tax=Scomber scombrus TaxID=13677 RepID=A0AAV1PMN2_SCOSC
MVGKTNMILPAPAPPAAPVAPVARAPPAPVARASPALPATQPAAQPAPPVVLEVPDPHPPAFATTIKADGQDPLRILVALLTVKVLTKCRALQSQNKADWVPHANRLIDQTMQGLSVNEDFCPDAKSTTELCRAVIKDLQTEFSGRRLMESVVLLQDPVVDRAIVRSLQTHIRDCSARLEKNQMDSSESCRDAVILMLISAVTVTMMFVLSLVLI